MWVFFPFHLLLSHLLSSLYFIKVIFHHEIKLNPKQSLCCSIKKQNKNTYCYIRLGLDLRLGLSLANFRIRFLIYYFYYNYMIIKMSISAIGELCFTLPNYFESHECLES